MSRFTAYYGHLRVQAGRPLEGSLEFHIWPKRRLSSIFPHRGRLHEAVAKAMPANPDPIVENEPTTMMREELDALIRDVADHLGYRVDWNAAREAWNEEMVR